MLDEWKGSMEAQIASTQLQAKQTATSNSSILRTIIRSELTQIEADLSALDSTLSALEDGHSHHRMSMHSHTPLIHIQASLDSINSRFGCVESIHSSISGEEVRSRDSSCPSSLI